MNKARLHTSIILIIITTNNLIADKFEQDYNNWNSFSETIYVSEGTHTFQVNSIPTGYWCEFYLNGVYYASKKAINIDHNLKYSWTLTNTCVVKARLWVEGTGYVEDHIWNVIINHPPNQPDNEDPDHTETEISINTNLNWSCTDDDPGDDLDYTIKWKKNLGLWKTGYSSKSYYSNLPQLEFYKKYIWYIIASDGTLETEGPVWEFTTRDNNAPYKPSSPNPYNGKPNVSRDLTLSWSGDDPDGDDVTYRMYYRKAGVSVYPISPEYEGSNLYHIIYGLDFDQEYVWKVVAEDEYGKKTQSHISPNGWHFTTRDEPNEAPYISSYSPTNNSTILVNKGDNLTFSITAKDNNVLSKNQLDEVEWWKDNSSEGRANLSGTQDTKNERITFSDYGTFTIKAIVKDKQGASDQETWQIRVNRPPTAPTAPIIPNDNDDDVSVNPSFSWSGGDDPDDDDISYVFKYKKGKLGSWNDHNTSSKSYNLNNLDFEQDYYWKVFAFDEHGELTKSHTDIQYGWKFTTENAYPDLEFISFTVDQNSIIPDDINPPTINLSSEFTNNGTEATKTTTVFYLRYYLSADENYDDNNIDKEIASEDYGGFVSLHIGEIWDDTESPKIKTTDLPVSSGPCYIIARIDATDKIDEIDEDNNIIVKRIEIIEPYKDLVVENQQILNNNDFYQGDEISTESDIKNIGNVTAGKSQLRYYISDDNYYNGGSDELLKPSALYNGDNVEELSPEEISHEEATLDIPDNTTTGSHYILFFADAKEEIIESNDDNNVSSSSLTIKPRPGDIEIAVKDYNGSYTPFPEDNAIVELRDESNTLVGDDGIPVSEGKKTNSYGKVTYSNMPAEYNYSARVFYVPSSTIFSDEYWGEKANINVISNQLTRVTFSRNKPFATDVNVYQGGQRVNGKTLSPDSEVTVKVSVKNPGSDTDIKVQLYLDRDKDAPWDKYYSTLYRYIRSDNIQDFSFTFTVDTLLGDFYPNVEIIEQEGDNVTDGWNWTDTPLFSNKCALITEFEVPTGKKERGNIQQANVTIQNITNEARSYWIGFSYAHESANGETWPVNFYDVKPIESNILEPNEEQTITFNYLIPEYAKTGQYYARAIIWDDFNKNEWKMVHPRFDDTQAYDKWKTNELGLISFSLPYYSVIPPGILSQIGEMVDYFAAGASNFTNIISAEDQYRDDGIKPLLYFGAEVGGTYGVGVSVGGTFLIDVADLMRITPEGKEGWVTVWVDGKGGLSAGAEVHVDVDFGITYHDFGYNTRAIADLRDDLIIEGSINAFGFSITGIEYVVDGKGIPIPKIDFTGTSGVSLSVSGEKQGLVSQEVNYNDLKNAFEEAFSDNRNLRQAIERLCNNLYDIDLNEIVRKSTWDDGSEQLGDSWITDLKLDNKYNGLNDRELFAHHFYKDVPDNTSELIINVGKGSGDADLFIKRNNRPDLQPPPDNISSTLNTNSESITISEPDAGKWYIMLPSISEYENVCVNAAVIMEGETRQPIVDFNLLSQCIDENVNIEDLSLYVTAEATYNWDINNDGSIEYSSKDISHSFNSPGNYDIKLTVTQNNNDYSKVKTIEIYGPDADAGPDRTVCKDDIIILEASGGINYEWSDNVEQGTPFIISETKTYKVVVTDEQGCRGEDEVRVEVIEPPDANAGEDLSICQGESVTLSATGGTYYEWDHGIMQNQPFNPNVTDTYTVVVSDDAGCQSTDNVTVNVIQQPIIALQPSIGNSTCGNSNGSITGLDVSGNSPFIYEWYNMQNELIASTKNVSNLSAGIYSLKVTGSQGCSSTFSYSVNNSDGPDAPNILAQTEFCEGQEISLQAQGSGGAINWYSNADLSNLLSTQEVFVSIATNSDDYFATETKGGCESTPAKVSITVHKSDLNLPDTIFVDRNDTTITIDAGPGYNSYKWSNDRTTQTIPVIPSDTANSKVYSVTIIDQNFCEFSDSTIVVFEDINNNITNRANSIIARIYPNPASDIVKIEISRNRLQIIESIALLDLTGKVLYKKEINSADEIIIIDVSDYLPGNYFIKINTLNKEISKKISIIR